MKPLRLLSLALLAGLALAGTAAAAPVIIAHKDLAGQKLDRPTLKAVFLGKKVAWDGAGRITLAVLKPGPVADEFLGAAVDLNGAAFLNYWRRLAMTGGGTSPKSFDKEDDLRRFVAETPGAVGFVDAASADASVVVLTVQ